MNDSQRITLTAASLGAIVGIALFISFLPERPSETPSSSLDEETIESEAGFLASDDIVTTYGYGDRPVRAARKTPRGRGRQMVDTSGHLMMDQLTVAVRDDEGNISYLRGDDPRALATVAEPPMETEEELRLRAATEQITSPVPSDNNSASTARLSLP